jgi:hypothetical protein
VHKPVARGVTALAAAVGRAAGVGDLEDAVGAALVQWDVGVQLAVWDHAAEWHAACSRRLVHCAIDVAISTRRFWLADAGFWPSGWRAPTELVRELV